MEDERKVEILEALREDEHFGLIAVRSESEGVLMYDSGARRVGGEPALEVPHPDPYLTENPPTSLSRLLSEYGCVQETISGMTYITVDENATSKRP